MAAEVYPGPFAQEAKITTQMLLHSALLPRVETVKKGLILELHGVLKSNLITWATFSKWIQILFNSEELKSWALRKSVTALSTRLSKMMRTSTIKQSLTRFYKNHLPYRGGNAAVNHPNLPKQLHSWQLATPVALCQHLI